MHEKAQSIPILGPHISLAISAIPLPGIQTIFPPKIAVLPPSMRAHADLQVCPLDEKVLLVAPEVYTYYKERLTPHGFDILCGESHLGRTYPEDAAYNIGRVGNWAIHNPKITDPVALRFFEARGIRMLPVRQGYAKCSILPVDASSLITADHGIYTAATRAGLSALEIQAGGVLLPGFAYGFLGGATGKIAADTLYCTGRLSGHPSYPEILTFLKKRGIKLEEGRIPIPIDIGSIFSIL